MDIHCFTEATVIRVYFSSCSLNAAVNFHSGSIESGER